MGVCAAVGEADRAEATAAPWPGARERVATGQAEAREDRLVVVHGALIAERRRVDAVLAPVRRPVRTAPGDGVRREGRLEEKDAALAHVYPEATASPKDMEKLTFTQNFASLCSRRGFAILRTH